tara:strand:- start:3681 stop:4040 length:360 start_codon:yes stop_codon:yes gene_type:complete
MKIGTELLLKEDSFCSKKGDKLLYLRHCTDSGFSCIEAVVIDEHYNLLMKEWGCYSLEQAYQSMKDNSIMPIDLEQFAIRFNTIKPRISDVCSIEDLLLEEKRLLKRLEEIQKLKGLIQ